MILDEPLLALDPSFYRDVEERKRKSTVGDYFRRQPGVGRGLRFDSSSKPLFFMMSRGASWRLSGSDPTLRLIDDHEYRTFKCERSLYLYQMCSLCGKPVALQECNTDGDGRVLHEDCYVDAETSTSHPSRPVFYELMSNRPAPIIRCPYCRVGHEFRTMPQRVEGWFQCENCGHNAMPLDPEFRCACSKCDASRSPSLPDSW
jgi:hypothetical protein